MLKVGSLIVLFSGGESKGAWCHGPHLTLSVWAYTKFLNAETLWDGISDRKVNDDVMGCCLREDTRRERAAGDRQLPAAMSKAVLGTVHDEH